MILKASAEKRLKGDENLILIGSPDSNFENYYLSKEEIQYIKSCFDQDKKLVQINQLKRWVFIQLIEKEENSAIRKEKLRKAAFTIHGVIVENKLKNIVLVDLGKNPEMLLVFAEGLALSNYQFLEYRKDKEDKKHSLKSIDFFSEKIKEKEISELNNLVDAVFSARSLVNQPLSYLSAAKFAEEIKKLGKKAGFSVTVFRKEKIEKLKMGGLLAVNKGSIDPPTFSILEWKPETAKNKKPLVLVGKGIVYDTGGLSLKPTQNSMDYMKSDMAGAAAVVAAIYAAAASDLPIHIVGLIPATDNRPDGNAYVPGDVIKMYNGLNVEVLNTDAEGRMILADALSYAKKYDPELVIDVATLTGAAVMALGSIAAAVMGTANKETFNKLEEAGENVYERIVKFPLWTEYGEMIKSDIADIKNIGGKYGGAITAGKFLEKFTDYPWIHIDIAGPSFLMTADSYRGKGGTGTAVRLLYEFVRLYGKL